MGPRMAGALEALKNFKVTPEIGRRLDLLGLGALSIPVAHNLAKADDNTDRLMAGTELGGLGLLAASTLAHR